VCSTNVFATPIPNNSGVVYIWQNSDKYQWTYLTLRSTTASSSTSIFSMTVPSVPPPVTNEQVIICVNDDVMLSTLRQWKEVPRTDALHMHSMLHLINQHTSQRSLQSTFPSLNVDSDKCFGNDGKHSSRW